MAGNRNPDQGDVDGDDIGDICDLPPTGRLFVVEGDTDTIYELNPATGAVINSFATPENASGAPDGLAYDPDENALYFTNGFGTRMIWKLDADTGATLTSFPPPTGDRSDGLGFHDGFLYSEAFQSELIIKINPATGNFVSSFPTSPPLNLSGGMDDGLFVINSLRTIAHADAADGTVLKSY